jgi:hypothetical protein
MNKIRTKTKDKPLPDLTPKPISISCVLGLNATKHFFQEPLQQPFDSIAHAHGRDTIQIVNIPEQLTRLGHVLLNQVMLGFAFRELAVRLSRSSGRKSRERSVVLFCQERELVAAAVEGGF